MSIHLRVFIAVVLGQIACGFALGISGTALSNASKYIQISDLWTGLIGAGSLIGLAGSILIGRLSDKIGRRKLLMLNMYVLGALSLTQLLINDFLFLFIIRVLIGLMIGLAFFSFLEIPHLRPMCFLITLLAVLIVFSYQCYKKYVLGKLL